jgi:hypothetical protein
MHGLHDAYDSNPELKFVQQLCQEEKDDDQGYARRRLAAGNFD